MTLRDLISTLMKREVLRMAIRDEHEDDLEPEVIEGTEIETEEYEEDTAPETEVTNSRDSPEMGMADADEEEPEGEASDTI